MKYLLKVYQTRKSLTLRLLTFFFLGWRWSAKEAGMSFKLFCGVHNVILTIDLSKKS